MVWQNPAKFGLTPWEQIEVTISNEVVTRRGVLPPDRILLDFYNTSLVSLVGETLNRYVTWMPTFILDLHELDR
jgi:hypothetical protein